MSPEETQLPNGMDWDMKKGVMYYNDTFMKEFGDTPGIIWELKVDQHGLPVRDVDGKLDRRRVDPTLIHCGKWCCSLLHLLSLVRSGFHRCALHVSTLG